MLSSTPMIVCELGDTVGPAHLVSIGLALKAKWYAVSRCRAERMYQPRGTKDQPSMDSAMTWDDNSRSARGGGGGGKLGVGSARARKILKKTE
jgi:hypothetical protein